jgi:hypothetical protein
MLLSLMSNKNLLFVSLVIYISLCIQPTSQLNNKIVQHKKLNKASNPNKTNKRQEKQHNIASQFTYDLEPEFELPPSKSHYLEYEQELVYDGTTRTSDLKVKITNMTAILGQNALLSCRVRNIGSYQILWLRVRDGDVLALDNMIVTQDSRFSIIRNSVNESNLFIQGIRLSDSGEYACQLNTHMPKFKLINLAILCKSQFQ